MTFKNPKKMLGQQKRNFSNDNILSFMEVLQNMNTESIFHCNNVNTQKSLKLAFLILPV